MNNPNLTPFEQQLDEDTALVVGDAYGPGLTVTVVDAVSGIEHPLRALFEAPGLDVTSQGSQAPVVSTAPTLHIQSTVVQHALGRPLSRRDRIILRGQSYRIQAPHTDGYGFVAIKLMEVGDE